MNIYLSKMNLFRLFEQPLIHFLKYQEKLGKMNLLWLIWATFNSFPKISEKVV